MSTNGSFLGVLVILIVVGVLIFGACLYNKNRDTSEHMTMSPHIDDIRYWPYYYYTLPYRYQQGGAYPPNMYTRMSHWQPGYDVHGWSFNMRPGMTYDKWRRNVWVKNNGSYYNIDNGTKCDRLHDYYGHA